MLKGEEVIAKDFCIINTKDNGRGGHTGYVNFILWKAELASATKLRTTMTTIND